MAKQGYGHHKSANHLKLAFNRHLIINLKVLVATNTESIFCILLHYYYPKNKANDH